MGLSFFFSFIEIGLYYSDHEILIKISKSIVTFLLTAPVSVSAIPISPFPTASTREVHTAILTH